MIKETTPLFPGNMGKDCAGNGDKLGTECLCDECDYLQCCIAPTNCVACTDFVCPRKRLFHNSHNESIFLPER